MSPRTIALMLAAGSMRRVMALLWLGVVLLIAAYLGHRLLSGLSFRTDLTALLPRVESDAGLRQATDAVAAGLARRVVVMVGHRDGERARLAAREIASTLAGSSDIEILDVASGTDRLRTLGAIYHRYRAGLVSDADRRDLQGGHGERLARRALSQIFGPVPFADANLIRDDPFLLLPGFIGSLPLPLGRLSVEDGMLGVVDADTSWILVSGRLRSSPYDIAVQERLVAALDAAVERQRRQSPELQVLRLGAVFYAKAGARSAMDEVNDIGTISVIGTILLVLLVFRSLLPLLLTQLSIVIGMGSGFAAALLLFDDLHVMSLLLGLSLIGVVADYSFYYCAQIFAPDVRTASERLARALPGITMGLLATMASYGLLLMAPLPGFRQLAVVAIAGLAGAYATVVLWYPVIDRGRPRRYAGLMAVADAVSRFWQGRQWHPVRLALVLALAVLGAVGAARFTIDDDVRRLQTLAPDLVNQQRRIEQLVGGAAGAQFFVVRGQDHETVLRRSEALLDRLETLAGSGALASYRAPASFVPSQQRQAENRALVASRLSGELLASHLQRLGLTASPLQAAPGALTLETMLQGGALDDVLRDMIISIGSEVAHIVAVDGLKEPAAARAAGRGLDGVTFVDPTADFSDLLGRYRERALVLVAISAVVVWAMVTVRFGWRRGARVMLPALAAALLAPLLRSFSGVPFTFFDAMALVLILGINIDYAIFCAESAGERQPVALIGVWMTMISTLMSFGMLSLSEVAAVHAFGATTAIGVLLAALLAPFAAPARKAPE